MGDEQICPCVPGKPDCENCELYKDSKYPVGSYVYDDDMLPYEEFIEKWGDDK